MTKVAILLLISFGFISTFAAGIYLGKIAPGTLDRPTNLSHSTPLITPSASFKPNTATTFLPENEHTQLLPGSHFYRDTVIVITKDAPHYTLAVTVTRDEQDKNDFFQSTTASYFNGSAWTRVKTEKTNKDPRIEADEIVKNWNSTIDPSRVLKQRIDAELTIENSTLQVRTEVLENEVSMRSLPGYTKFMAQGKAELEINGSTHESYVLLTRIYSLNVDNIQFYSEPIGLTTDWLAFWDKNDNFYHVDATHVEHPTPIYQTHQIGVTVTADKSTVRKTFDVNISRAPSNIPQQYTFDFPSPIHASLNLQTTNSFAKEPESGFDWFAGNVVGEARLETGEKIQGVGFVEYIHDDQ